MAKKFKTL